MAKWGRACGARARPRVPPPLPCSPVYYLDTTVHGSLLCRICGPVNRQSRKRYSFNVQIRSHLTTPKDTPDIPVSYTRLNGRLRAVVAGRNAIWIIFSIWTRHTHSATADWCRWRENTFKYVLLVSQDDLAPIGADRILVVELWGHRTEPEPVQ